MEEKESKYSRAGAMEVQIFIHQASLTWMVCLAKMVMSGVTEYFAECLTNPGLGAPFSIPLLLLLHRKSDVFLARNTCSLCLASPHHGSRSVILAWCACHCLAKRKCVPPVV
jgi:hypothetical protein